jgi:hypothetical protein
MSNDHEIPTVEEMLTKPEWDWDKTIDELNPANPKHAFYLRAYKARRAFGLWDAHDPAVYAIVALVEAQNDIAMATEADSMAIADAPDMTEALTARAEAAVNLMRALLVETELTWTPQGWGARTEWAQQQGNLPLEPTRDR